MYAIFTKESIWGVATITEDIQSEYHLVEYTEENKQAAIEDGFKFAHVYSEHVGDYDNFYYSFITTEIL